MPLYKFFMKKLIFLLLIWHLTQGFCFSYCYQKQNGELSNCINIVYKPFTDLRLSPIEYAQTTQAKYAGQRNRAKENMSFWKAGGFPE